MQEDFIDQIEPTPSLYTKKCRLISFLVRVFLQFTTLIVGIVVLLSYDYFIAIASALLSFIVMGIVRSKIRNSVIPPTQQEYQYSDKVIADWFSAKEICFRLK